MQKEISGFPEKGLLHAKASRWLIWGMMSDSERMSKRFLRLEVH